jgi:hypothetical protein
MGSFVILRVAMVLFSLVQRHFSPNPEALWGPVRFRSGSGPDPFRTLTEPLTPNLALFAYIIKLKLHIELVMYRKKRQSTLLW